jgi:hypothetical protein
VQHDRVEVQHAAQRREGRRTDGAARPGRATHRPFGCVHCNKIGNPGATRSSVLHPAARAGATPPRAERGRAVALQQTRAWVTSPLATHRPRRLWWHRCCGPDRRCCRRWPTLPLGRSNRQVAAEGLQHPARVAGPIVQIGEPTRDPTSATMSRGRPLDLPHHCLRQQRMSRHHADERSASRTRYSLTPDSAVPKEADRKDRLPTGTHPPHSTTQPRCPRHRRAGVYPATRPTSAYWRHGEPSRVRWMSVIAGEADRDTRMEGVPGLASSAAPGCRRTVGGCWLVSIRLARAEGVDLVGPGGLLTWQPPYRRAVRSHQRRGGG